MMNKYSGELLEVPAGRLIIPGDFEASSSTEKNNLPRPWLSLVVPTYNESNNIEDLVATLCPLLHKATNGDYELIIVDDNSPDATWEKAQSLTSEYPHLKVMRRVHERGLATAVIRGWQVAQGKVMGVIDGDLQHPPETLVKMIDRLRLGADVVVASRHVEHGGVDNWSLTRRLLSRGAQVLGLIICPSIVGRVSDPMSGYFLVRRHAIADISLDPHGYKILLEVLGRGSANRIEEVGYVFRERIEGESKVTSKQYVDYIVHLLKLRSRGRVGRIRQKIKIPFSRFVRFALVGLSGIFVDMAILFLLSDPSMLGWKLTRSKIVAAEIAIINNFIWNDRWTFGDISRNQRRWSSTLKRLLKFNLICLMGLILNVLLLNLFFNVFGVNRYLANLMAIAFVTIWNFWINLKLSWRVTDPK
jgi:dolichol-phosphate mannosyltransferase